MSTWFDKRKAGWIIIAALVLSIGVVVSLLVLAGSTERDFTATPYSDVIRFEAEGVASLQVGIFDLSGRELWDSDVVSSWVVDWDRTNKWGERLAYGAYIYSAQGWNAQGGVIFQKNGKLALMPGDKVQLQEAPVPVLHPSEMVTPESNDAQVRPMAGGTACGCNEFSGGNKDVYVAGKLGVGTTSPANTVHVIDSVGIVEIQSTRESAGAAFQLTSGLNQQWRFTGGNNRFKIRDHSNGLDKFVIQDDASGDVYFDNVGNVGIGTSSPSASLEIHGSATNLLALYDPAAPGDAKFRVTKTGKVRADGAYYGAGYNTGAADVAERINTSEWVEKGNVVEIDPEHPGFFRKTRSPYSTGVAGIISTSPGITLGNNFDPKADKWEDNRPMLALAGRVPVKVTAEDGPIQIGDLLVSSSTPGYAMRCSDRAACVGAVIGKVLEPLEEGTGIIMIQVMLR